ncbi:hypothetical protein J6590_030916 [Homalodisca vitripennis]|nr:hypothetical protein J6590_030916 [Homalodisca vitripennis]
MIIKISQIYKHEFIWIKKSLPCGEKVNKKLKDNQKSSGRSPNPTPPKNKPRANGALKWLSGYRPRGLTEDCRT